MTRRMNAHKASVTGKDLAKTKTLQAVSKILTLASKTRRECGVVSFPQRACLFSP